MTRKIRKAKDKFCPMVKMSELFIHPSDVKFPFTVTSDLKKYTIQELASTLATGEPCVMDRQGHCPLPVEELLFFEPYFGFHRELIQELFEKDPEERVPEDFLARLAKQVYCRRTLYEQMICPDPSIHGDIQSEIDPFRQCLQTFRALHRRIKPSYKNFHEQLDKFSIFGGRNPMVSDWFTLFYPLASQLASARMGVLYYQVKVQFFLSADVLTECFSCHICSECQNVGKNSVF